MRAFFILLLAASAPTDTDTTGSVDEVIDTRRFTPVAITSVPAQSWTEGSPITQIDGNTYLNCGRNAETFLTHNWTATGLPSGVTINASTGIISGTPAQGTAGALSATITCDNQCTGDGCPADTTTDIAMSGTIADDASSGGAISADYYADLDGVSGTDCDDTWAGTLPEPNGGPTNGPWCTWSKISATISGGDEVAILTGTSETAGEFAVSVNGTSGDRTIIRTYCLNAGSPEAWTSGGTGCSTRAELIGNDTDDDVMKISGDHFSLISIELSRTDHVGDGSRLNTLKLTGDNFLVDDYYDEGWGTKAAAITASGNSKTTQGILIESSAVGTVQNSTIRFSSGQNLKVQSGATYIKILNNDLRTAYGDSLRAHGDCGVTERHLFEGNQIGDLYTSDAFQNNRDFSDPDTSNTCASNMVVRNNTMYGAGVEENGVDHKGAEFLLVEGNTVAGFPGDDDGPGDGQERCTGASGIMKGGGGSHDTPIIIRRNKVYDNCGGIAASGDRAVYNNTVVGNNRDYSGANTTFTKSGEPYVMEIKGSIVDSTAAGNGVKPAIVRNNIMCYNNVAAFVVTNIDNSNLGIDVDYNLYCSSGWQNATDTNSSTPSYYSTITSWRTALSAVTGNASAVDGYPGSDGNSIVGDPSFTTGSTDPVYGGSYDWTPTAAALGAGGHLTRAVGAGTNSTSLTVDRADVFYDAWICDSAPATYTCNEQKDTIVIGTGAAVQISDINYTTNVITLSAARSWANNDRVYLDKINPDIGAIEVE